VQESGNKIATIKTGTLRVSTVGYADNTANLTNMILPQDSIKGVRTALAMEQQ
jgi:hypothetical protein